MRWWSAKKEGEMNKQFDREVEDLEQRLGDGLISTKEFNEEMREMERGYREQARDAAQEEYDREMNR